MKKTLRSRVAAVAVVVLGAGLLTAAPSLAATSSTVPFTVTAPATGVTGNETATVAVEQLAGVGNYVEIQNKENINSAPTSYKVVTITGGNFFGATLGGGSNAAFNSTTPQGSDWAFNGSGFTTSTQAIFPDTGNPTDDILQIATPTAGTVTVKFATRAIAGGVATDTVTQTITITVVSALTAQTYSYSTVTETVGTGGYKLTNAASEVIGRYATAASSSTSRFNFQVQQYNANDTLVTSGYNKSVVATLTGVGTLYMASGTPATGTLTEAQVLSFKSAQSGNSDVNFDVRGDGRAGVSTLEIKVNSVVVKTYSITFYGAVASYDIKVNNAYIGVGATKSTALTVTAKDANGVPVPNTQFFVKSGDTTIATVGTASPTTRTAATTFGTQDVELVGVAKGTVTLTVANSGTAASITVSKTASVQVTGTTIKTLTWAFDKPSYTPGEKATITFTAKDSDGNPVGDGAYSIFATGPSANVTLGTFTPSLGASITTTSGVAKWSGFMPATTGVVTVSGTLESTAILDAALRGAATSITATVVNTDLDAVKAQVAALTVSLTNIQTAMSTLVASVTATLTALTAKINKIMKKLKIK